MSKKMILMAMAVLCASTGILVYAFDKVACKRDCAKAFTECKKKGDKTKAQCMDILKGCVNSCNAGVSSR